ncbi:MAG: DUF5103 domain-containing protein [Anditalea sp.]
MQNFLTLAIFVFSFFSSYFIDAQSVFVDKVYEENIQTVRIYPKTPEFSSQMASPIIALNSLVPLVLEFDDIAYEADIYSAKIIHCNADWTPSGLKAADYLNQYNEFNVNQYEYSINTRIPFIHFTFQVPRVKKSGNYILKIYRGRDEDEVIITKRFMIYNNQLIIGASVVPPSKTEDRKTSQQINLNVNYGGRELLDPINNVKVVIRQNQRWDNAIIGLKPSFIRIGQSLIEYQLFDGSNIFSAGNEFRFVDLRYIRSKGRNIASVKIEEDAVFAETTIDQPRAGQAYLEYLDLNGQFGVFTFEKQNHELESEYVLTTFHLKSDPLPGNPYILGALSNWGKKPEAKMVYDDKKGMYQATLLLKQGWYDYKYGLETPEGWELEKLEGEHFQTENEYEIFIYYRDMGSRYDELIGYTVLNPNKRRL